MGPVAVLVLYTLTEESNFMHKLYSWITVPPEIVVKIKSAFQSPTVPRAGERNGVWFGAMSRALVPGGSSCTASPVGLALLARQRA